MIRSFGDRGTEDIYQGDNTKPARKKCPRELCSKARDLMDVLNYASELKDTERTPGARLHSLAGQRANQYAVSINDQYRITFRWTDNGAEEVTVEDYHRAVHQGRFHEEGMNAMRTRVPEDRRPAHPGELLERLFLDPLDMTQSELAERLAVPYKRVNSLVNGRRSVTAETALLLARLFDTTPEYWMNMQAGYDLWEAQQGESLEKLKRVEPISS